ncbi:MAG: diguanylate cyclase [Chloroflexota bacterium]
MNRVLGVLGLVVLVATIVVVTASDSILLWWDQGGRAVVAAAGAGLVGVTLTSLLALSYLRFKMSRLVSAAERLATGDYRVTVNGTDHLLEGRLARAINQLAKTLEETHDKATVDRLTGVANRQALLGALFQEVERATRYDRPLSVAFVDIDHFKAVNDSYGHSAGDLVLRGVAQTLQENLRASDQMGRYGGEEFMLILTETDVEDGSVLCEKLRTLVQRRRFAVEGNADLSVTISIGIAGGFGAQLRTDSLVRDADAAMYSAKSLGRNQTYVFAEPDEDARVPRAPISASGRARAVEIGRAARDAATASLTEVIAPLPHYRGRPSPLIASIVADLARRLDLPEAEIDRLKVAAILHDVGKVAVPQELLEKPTALTSAEWRTVVQHPRIGQVILEQAAAVRDAVPIILHHHERYAGHGYPYGLRGNEIPLGARIVAIADAYDAMTNDRPYKGAMRHEEAIAELRQHAGTQFDPELVAMFCDLYADRPPVGDPTVEAMNRQTDRSSHDGPGGPAAPGTAVGSSNLGTGGAAPDSDAPRKRRPAASAQAEQSLTMGDGGDGSVQLHALEGGRPDPKRGPLGQGAAAG